MSAIELDWREMLDRELLELPKQVGDFASDTYERMPAMSRHDVGLPALLLQAEMLLPTIGGVLIPRLSHRDFKCEQAGQWRAAVNQERGNSKGVTATLVPPSASLSAVAGAGAVEGNWAFRG
jgi:hypothetical protein